VPRVTGGPTGVFINEEEEIKKEENKDKKDKEEVSKEDN
jgi:hypothetical protein